MYTGDWGGHVFEIVEKAAHVRTLGTFCQSMKRAPTVRTHGHVYTAGDRIYNKKGVAPRRCPEVRSCTSVQKCGHVPKKKRRRYITAYQPR